MSQPISDRDLERMFCDMLDQCFGSVKIAGYEYVTSHALALVDPNAFRCGFADYISSLIDDGQIVEFCGEYYDPADVPADAEGGGQ